MLMMQARAVGAAPVGNQCGREHLTSVDLLSAVFVGMATKETSALFARLIRDFQISTRTPAPARVRDAFDMPSDALKQRGFRDEYIYKAALTHRLLLGTHKSPYRLC
jgi:hypothetical protein